MVHMTHVLLESLVTFCCSILSWIGSVLVLCSYWVASTKSNALAAALIRNLAITDFVWFSCSIIISTYWIFAGNPGNVPAGVCYVTAPLLMYLRMASLLWTCAISFDVLMSVKKRRWFSEKLEWLTYRQRYYMLVYLLPFPGAVATIAQSALEGSPLGCDAGYEPIGTWYLVLLMELLPISIGFICNIFVFIQIREKMSLKAFPQSVRKRRRLVMFHYIVVCIVCWTPTMIFYIAEMCGIHMPTLELVARTSLYMTGFFNFIVFGLQDPHLKRSFQLVLFKTGLQCLLPELDTHMGLKLTNVEKNVCFEETTISGNADISKDKKNIYRHHKLSKSDKARLYKSRPDLNPDPRSDMDNGLTESLLGDSDEGSSNSSSNSSGARRRKSKKDKSSSKRSHKHRRDRDTSGSGSGSRDIESGVHSGSGSGNGGDEAQERQSLISEDSDGSSNYSSGNESCDSSDWDSTDGDSDNGNAGQRGGGAAYDEENAVDDGDGEGGYDFDEDEEEDLAAIVRDSVYGDPSTTSNTSINASTSLANGEGSEHDDEANVRMRVDSNDLARSRFRAETLLKEKKRRQKRSAAVAAANAASGIGVDGDGGADGEGGRVSIGDKHGILSPQEGTDGPASPPTSSASGGVRISTTPIIINNDTGVTSSDSGAETGNLIDITDETPDTASGSSSACPPTDPSAAPVAAAGAGGARGAGEPAWGTWTPANEPPPRNELRQVNNSSSSASANATNPMHKTSNDGAGGGQSSPKLSFRLASSGGGRDESMDSSNSNSNSGNNRNASPPSAAAGVTSGGGTGSGRKASGMLSSSLPPTSSLGMHGGGNGGSSTGPYSPPAPSGAAGAGQQPKHAALAAGGTAAVAFSRVSSRTSNASGAGGSVLASGSQPNSPNRRGMSPGAASTTSKNSSGSGSGSASGRKSGSGRGSRSSRKKKTSSLGREGDDENDAVSTSSSSDDEADEEDINLAIPIELFVAKDKDQNTAAAVAAAVAATVSTTNSVRSRSRSRSSSRSRDYS